MVFGLYAGKYGPEKTPYLDTFHAVLANANISNESMHPAMCWAAVWDLIWFFI